MIYVNYISSNNIIAPPNSVTSITFSFSFNRSVDTFLPPFLTHIIFGSYFNQPVHSLPPSLKYIHFGDSFNQPVANLPPLLTHLRFGYSFSQEANALPASIVHLTFGEGFIPQQLRNIPPHLSYLYMHKFTSTINLPESMETLILPSSQNFPLPNLLNLKKLICDSAHPILALPPNLTQLTLSNYDFGIGNLPRFLTHLKFGERFNQSVDNLPPTLHFLEFGEYFNRPVETLPKSLRILRFICLYGHFNHLLTKLPPLSELHIRCEVFSKYPLLPALRVLELSSFSLNKLLQGNLPTLHQFSAYLKNTLLTHLTLGSSFNLPVSCGSYSRGKNKIILPPSLTHLAFGNSFNQPVDYLPKGLRLLSVGIFFNQPVNSLPQSLQHLLLGQQFNQPVDSLPTHLTHLTFGDRFNQRIDKLPPSVTHLQLHKYFTFKQPLILPLQIRDLTIFDTPSNPTPPINTLCYPQKVRFAIVTLPK